MPTPGKPFAIGLFLVLSLGFLAGCPKKGTPERTTVAVSIFPVYDLVRRIAGPDADVTLVLPPGRTPHAFDPPKDVASLAKTKVGVMIGLGLDPWMERLLQDAAPKARIVKVGDRVPTLTETTGDKATDDDKGATDPHVWLDPERARLIVRAVAEELGRVDATHAIAYRERATELDKSLDALDKEVESRTKALPTKGFVTFHGSFQYFAERYKLQILAVIEPSPGTPPSSEQSKKVLDVVKAKKVPALFSEPQLDPRPAKVLADEAKIRLGVLDPLGGSPETDSYEKLMRFDVTQLEKDLK